MSLVPYTRAGKVSFYQSKIAPWTANAVAIGTSSAAVTDLQTKLTAAQTLIAAQVAAMEAAKTATMAADNAVDQLAIAGANIISSIRAKGRTGGITVFELAEIPAPATPSARPNPGKPFDFKVALLDDGSLKFNFSCDNPVGTSGTMYQLFRGDPGQISDLTYIGGVGKKEFIDDSIPAGKTALMYKIQAVRSTAAGLWATFNVFFGTNASGLTTATLVEAPSKLAA